MLWEEHKTSEWFTWFKHEKLQLKMWAFALSLPTLQVKVWTGFTVIIIIIKDKQSTILEMWPVRPLIENNLTDPRGEWNVWVMSWICSLVAHWWVSSAACVCEPGTVGWRQELPKHPPKEHNKKLNLGVLLWPRNQTESPQWESHLWQPKKIKWIGSNIRIC